MATPPSDSRASTLLAHLSVAFWDWPNPEYQDQYWSPELLRLLEYRSEDPSSRFTRAQYKDHVHPDDREAEEALFSALASPGESLEVEYRLRTTGGVYRRVRVQVLCIPSVDKSSHSYGAQIVDVSAIHDLEAENARHKARWVAAQQLARFGLCEQNTHTGHMTWSPGLAHLLLPPHSTADDVLDSDLTRSESGVPPQLKDAIKTVLGSENSVSEMRSLRRDDGQIRNIWLTNGVNPDSQANLDQKHCLAMDVTDLPSDSMRVSEAAVTDREATPSKGLTMLAGGVAHEFNNILLIILGNTQLIRADSPEDASSLPLLTEIEEAGRRGANLCQQMLAFAGREVIERFPLDLASTLQEFSGLLQSVVAHGITLEIRPSAGLPLICADKSRIRQLLFNLVINASEALSESGGSIRISMGCNHLDADQMATLRSTRPCEPGNYVFIEVADSGPGVDHLIRDQIFEPFFSTKFTGRGLGLPAVLGIVGGHDGLVGISSQPGKGTRIRIHFPTDPGVKPRAGEGPGQRLGELRTVIVIDDEKPVLRLCQRMLERMGFDVHTANSGSEGLALYEKHQDEVLFVLLDLTMPGMDGRQTFEELAKIDPDVRVIVASGYASEEIMSGFSPEKAHPLGFMEKPYSLSLLEEWIAKARSVANGESSTSTR